MKYHPHKEINSVIEYALEQGWRFEKATGGSAHAHSKILCGFADRDGCRLTIYSTPKNPENFARRIKREIDKCAHIQND